MIRKYKWFYGIFQKLILNKRKIDKNKDKNFILYCENNKMNWILFRNIIEVSRYHFKLEPLIYVTDSIGFEDITENVGLNPYNPTFNILTKIDLDLKKEKIIHNDITGIRYCVWWDELKNISKKRTNLFLFTNNINELQELVKTVESKNRETIIIHLKTKKDESIPEKLCTLAEEIWEVPYKTKYLYKFFDLSLFQTIKTKINIRKNKKIRSVRNKIYTIMSQYYKHKIVPSYYNDEEKFESLENFEDEIVSLYENKK